MGCCGKTKKETPFAKIKKRSCIPTDLPFLLLYIVFWIALIVVWNQAKASGGDPKKIIYGVDMYGRVCGHDEGVENSSYAAWPNPLYYQPKICVSTCNETQNKESTRMAVLYESVQFAGYCVPQLLTNASLSFDISADSQFSSAFTSTQQVISRGIRDIYETQYVILLSGLTAIVFVFLAIFIIRIIAGKVIAVLLTLIVVSSTFSGAAMFSWASDPANNLGEDAIYGQVLGGTILGLGFIFFCVIIFLRKSIQIAVEVVKEASKAIQSMKSIMFFPIYPALLGVVYMLFWIFTGLYIWSVSTLVPKETPEAVRTYNALFFPEKVASGANMTNANPAMMQRFTVSDDWRNVSAVHFFHLLWTVQFFVYFGYLVFAGATCDWYFTRDCDEKGKKIRGKGEHEFTKWPVCQSFKRSFIYHMGTVALCALIIAIVQMIRAIIMYIEKQTKGDPPNKLQAALFKCIQCCLKCLECCLDKLNRNALIWTAIMGDGFCTSACSAFALLWRNLHRVAAITVVGAILLNMTVMIVCGFNTGLIWAFLNYGGMFDITSPVGPTLVVFILSYMIAKCFMTVFAAVIDTIFMCFLIDCETNTAGNMVASTTLQKLVGKYKEKSQECAKQDRATHKRRPHDGTVEIGDKTGNEVTEVTNLKTCDA